MDRNKNFEPTPASTKFVSFQQVDCGGAESSVFNAFVSWVAASCHVEGTRTNLRPAFFQVLPMCVFRRTMPGHSYGMRSCTEAWFRLTEELHIYVIDFSIRFVTACSYEVLVHGSPAPNWVARADAPDASFAWNQRTAHFVSSATTESWSHICSGPYGGLAGHIAKICPAFIHHWRQKVLHWQPWDVRQVYDGIYIYVCEMHGDFPLFFCSSIFRRRILVPPISP